MEKNLEGVGGSRWREGVGNTKEHQVCRRNKYFVFIWLKAPD